ncbi:MAG: type II secretion system F family protein [Candidatus Firestonebacteria bacterium]
MVKTFKRIKQPNLMLFSKELTILIKSGLPIVSCLKILTEHTADSNFKKVIFDIKTKVEAGSSLSDAFACHPNIFSRFYTTSIRAGESGDTVTEVLMYLYEHLNFVKNLRKKVLSALIYPAFLFLITGCAVFYLLIFVIPVFSKLYAEIGQNLPYLTRLLIEISNAIKSNIIWIICAIIVLKIIWHYWINVKKNRQIVDKIKLKIPMLGDLAKKYMLTHFFLTLKNLLKSGVPLPKALEVSMINIDNMFLFLKMKGSIESVNAGLGLATALNNTGIVPGMAIEMIHTGEETGSLEDMLNSISDIYEEEVSTAVSSLLVILEPLLMLVMGAIIASILLAMYLPIFEMSARF